MDAVLGLRLLDAPKAESIEDEVARKIEEREEARRRRDFAAADGIRKELLAKGIVLEDTPVGPSGSGYDSVLTFLLKFAILVAFIFSLGLLGLAIRSRFERRTLARWGDGGSSRA